MASPFSTRHPYRAVANASTEANLFCWNFSRHLAITSENNDEILALTAAEAMSLTSGAFDSISPATLIEAAIGDEQSKGSDPDMRWKRVTPTDQMSVAKDT